MYACLWYLLLARPIEDIPREDRYCCKAELAGLWLDRKALLQVSSYLGHGRPNVTVDYIAPFVHCTDDGNLAITNPLSLFSGIDEYFLF